VIHAWCIRPLAIVLCLAVVGAGSGYSSRRTTASSECATSLTIPSPADTTPDLRLTLNVPAYRLDVIEEGRTVRSISVAVGQPKYRTPLGHFRIDHIVWNPWWRPPNSEWARNERVTPPGWKNPVGRVKLHVTGLVFLHGTPLEDSRGSAASHACLRMSNLDAIALATLVQDRAGPPPSPAGLDSLVADTTKTRTVILDHTVPIDVVYWLAEVRGDDLVVHPDVYSMASRRGSVERHVTDAFIRAGLDAPRLSPARMRALVRDSRRAPVRVRIADLLEAPLPVTPIHW